MEHKVYCILNAIIFGVLLNLILPLILKPFATNEEIKPPNGAKNYGSGFKFCYNCVNCGIICVFGLSSKTDSTYFIIQLH